MIFTEVLPRSIDDRVEKSKIRISDFVIAPTRRTIAAGILLPAISAVEIARISIGQSQCPLTITPREELGVWDESSTSSHEELCFEVIVTDNIAEVHRLGNE